MSASSAATGRYGEDVAAAYLAGAGMTVLERNWRCRWGELDIVLRDGPWLVGAEVKTRRSLTAGTPLESITPRKVATLRRLLQLWAAEHPEERARMRLDAVAVWPQPAGPARVEHLRGIG